LFLGGSAPLIVEIGFGLGETTAAIAAACPLNDYIGIEVHTPGVGSLLKLIEEHGLSNLRVVQHDAVEVFEEMLGPDTLDGVHVFFPDPWPKKRHHKRRLLTAPFVHELALWRVTRDGVRKELSWRPRDAWTDAVATWKDAQTIVIDYAVGDTDKRATLTRRLADTDWVRAPVQ
jgi:tRNA (guanine-N7-)-methyltransferase